MEDCFEVVHADETITLFIEILECTSTIADIPLGEYILHSSLLMDELYIMERIVWSFSNNDHYGIYCFQDGNLSFCYNVRSKRFSKYKYKQTFGIN